jgi:DNA topoisomerase-1
MPSRVVVVESPSKARTLGKYLGPDYTVLASYGHVRDLPSRNGSVLPDKDFALEWEPLEAGEKHVKAIAKASREAETVYLATDPDREGEAISWHVWSMLDTMLPARKRPTFKRAVFHEVTRKAVLHALEHPRDLDQNLIDACLARRALDYLVGFTLSPILWRKLPGSRSAGRVQSVALRLLTDREREIEAFRTREYWSVEGRFMAGPAPVQARLDWFDGQKTEKFSIPDQTTADRWTETLRQAQAWTVTRVERSEVRRHPAAPFTTSTLQQEAARRGMSVSRVMQIAQSLYEGIDLGGERVGLITYMRTDSVHMAQEAVQEARQWIGETWGGDYVHPAPRVYKNRQKNAQEAHEAIRPTRFARHPDQVRAFLTPDQARLYELVWTRAVASQMASAVFDQMGVDIRDASGQVGFRATGSRRLFDGFLKLYRDAADEDTQDGEEVSSLPPLAEGDRLALDTLDPRQHFTQPPPRYTEASLVKKMEELGIGRPSTYASILHVLQERKYARLENRRFVPEGRGRLVTSFLVHWFSQYVTDRFTADLEDQLDAISAGRTPWKAVLAGFWKDFSATCKNTEPLRIAEVLDIVEADLEAVLFPPQAEGDPRQCPRCQAGRMGLKLSRYGAFVGCSGYPECKYTRPLSPGDADLDAAPPPDEGPLGHDPETGQPVFLKKGPWGFYVQRGEGQPAKKSASRKTKGKTEKNKEEARPDVRRCALPRAMNPGTVSLKDALDLLKLPHTLGAHPDTRTPVVAGMGRFGPYILHQERYYRVPDVPTLLAMTLEQAVLLIQNAPAPKGKPRAARKPSASAKSPKAKTRPATRSTPRRRKAPDA